MVVALDTCQLQKLFGMLNSRVGPCWLGESADLGFRVYVWQATRMSYTRGLKMFLHGPGG